MPYALFALLLHFAARARVIDLDVFHQMALARESLASGGLLLTDVWAFTPTLDPVVHHEWGTGAVLYAIVVSAGLGGAGILVLYYLLVLATALAVRACARLRGADDVALLAVAPVALALFALALSPVRAQLFSLALLAVLLWLLERDRGGDRTWLLAWLPVYVAWVNLHGGFVVGLAFLFAHWTERFALEARTGGMRAAARATWHLVALGIAMAALSVASPFGIDNPRYLLRALSMDRPLISEWAPLWDPRVAPGAVPVFALSVLFVVYALGRSPGGVARPGAAVLLVAALGAVQHQRALPIYAVAWACYLPGWIRCTPLQALLDAAWARRRVAGPVLATAATLAVGARLQGLPGALEIPNHPSGAGPSYPVGAVEYLRFAGFTGRLATPFDDGAYVLWSLHPKVLVSMDSRYEAAYPAGALEANLALYAGREGWQALLARDSADAVLVPRWSPLNAELPASLGWVSLYRDDDFAVFAPPGLGLPVANRSGERIVGTLR